MRVRLRVRVRVRVRVRGVDPSRRGRGGAALDELEQLGGDALERVEHLVWDWG